MVAVLKDGEVLEEVGSKGEALQFAEMMIMAEDVGDLDDAAINKIKADLEGSGKTEIGGMVFEIK